MFWESLLLGWNSVGQHSLNRQVTLVISTTSATLKLRLSCKCHKMAHKARNALCCEVQPCSPPAYACAGVERNQQAASLFDSPDGPLLLQGGHPAKGQDPPKGKP